MQNIRSSYVATIAAMSVADLPGINPNIPRRLFDLGVETVGQLVTEWSERRLLREGYWIGRGSIGAINASLSLLGVRSLGREVPRSHLEILD